MNSRSIGWLVGWLVGAAVFGLAIAGCPKPDSSERPIVPLNVGDDGKGDADEVTLDLPEIPANMEVIKVDPMSGDSAKARSPLLDIMLSEAKRSMAVLTGESTPAYYLSYQIHDQRSVIIETDGGALTTYADDNDRFLDTEIRVGSPVLDNRHTLSSEQQDAFNAPLVRRGVIPVSSDELAIRHHLWLDTDRRYREAALAYGAVLMDRSVTQQDDAPPDFAPSKPETYIEPMATLTFDKDEWIDRARRCSKRAFRGVATRATCRIAFEQRTTYFVNSEGTVLQQSGTAAQLAISVGVKADDGMPLGRTEQRFGRTPEDLPSDEEIDELIATVTADLNALHRAPVVDPYVGPAILEGRAAGVFFHEVFGHRIEGHRQKQHTSGQTFTSKVGKQIAPEWLSVVDDPTATMLNSTPLNGFYRFDDEGVRAQPVSLVKDGVLEGFLMSRDPIKGFSESNGHGRKEPGRPAVSRQGNLVVSASRSITKEELEDALIAEVQRQGKPFGMIFTDISGGFTNTSRFLPQAFKVNPVMAYRIYTTGRRELVRGVDIVGTPLTAMGSIMAASREVETFNGVCGAESGWVPVSASAPSLLLRSLEVERGFTGVDRPPVLPPPTVESEDEPRNVRAGAAR